MNLTAEFCNTQQNRVLVGHWYEMSVSRETTYRLCQVGTP